MKLQKLLLSALLCGCSIQVFAQRWSHQLGLAAMTSWETPYRYTAVFPDRPPKEVVTPRDPLLFFGAHYHVSCRLVEWPQKQMSLGLGVPLSASLFLSTSTNDGPSPRNYTFFSIPLQAELNFGTAAVAGRGKFGGFVGLGGGLQAFHARSYYYYGEKLRYSQFNGYLSAGIRLPMAGRPVQIAVARAFPLKKRAHLGELASSNYGGADFRRSLLRGTDVLSISIFLGKKHLIKPASTQQ